MVSTASGGEPPYGAVWSPIGGTNLSGSNASYTYPAAGNYVVTLRVSDAFGLEVTRSFPVSVTLPEGTSSPLAVVTSANRTEGTAPFPVQFATTLAGGDSPYVYSWEFGDGANSALAEPSHVFTTAGTFAVQVTVLDAQSLAANSSVTITVHPGLGFSIQASADQGSPPLSVNFSGAPTGGWAPYLVLWQFGDGSGPTFDK
jgi:PKD repeat protein